MLQKPNAARKNTLICAGTASFGSLSQSKTEGSPYWMEEVHLTPQGAGQKAKFRFMWDPAFFEPGFSTSDLNKSSEFVYKKNIASLDGQSLLEGLCGSNEVWENLQEGLAELTAFDADTIHEYFSNFFSELGPVPVIYTLRQERKKDGEDADGKPRYVRGPYYEVDSIQHMTEKNLKSLVKRVEGNAKRIQKDLDAGKEPPVKTVFTFDPTDFGFDIEVPQDQPAWVA